MKFEHILSILLFFASLAACVEKQTLETFGYVSVDAVLPPATKTEISGLNISFVKGDRIGVLAAGANSLALSNETSPAVNTFVSKFARTGIVLQNTDYYAVYPYKGKMAGDNVIGYLPVIQQAPFDGSANIMVADKVNAAYDEDNMPALSLTFRQTLGLIKVSISNTDPALENEMLNEISLTSETAILSGEYSLNLKTKEAAFSGNNPSLDRRVVSRFPAPVKLGVNVVHSFYLFVNPVRFSDAKIKILTDKNRYLKSSAVELAPAPGKLTTLPVIDVATLARSAAPTKTIACWGDSYTNREKFTPNNNECNYSYHLQQMLGREYKIYNGGVSGDKTVSISARQGSVQVYTGAPFILPAGTSPVTVDGLFLNVDWQGLPVNWYKVPINWTENYSFVNPCTIKGIECIISYNTVRRVSPGASVTIPEHSPIITYGASHLKSADLTIIYMGQNGTWGGDFVKLADQYDKMINSLEKNQDYLALGFHNSRHNDEYRLLYEQRFGKRFVNLHTGVIGRYEEMLVRTGVSGSKDEILPIDREYALSDQWPLSFWYANGDIHPSKFGGKAIAILIYEKMMELGYI